MRWWARGRGGDAGGNGVVCCRGRQGRCSVGVERVTDRGTASGLVRFLGGGSRGGPPPPAVPAHLPPRCHPSSIHLLHPHGAETVLGGRPQLPTLPCVPEEDHVQPPEAAHPHAAHADGPRPVPLLRPHPQEHVFPRDPHRQLPQMISPGGGGSLPRPPSSPRIPGGSKLTLILAGPALYSLTHPHHSYLTLTHFCQPSLRRGAFLCPEAPIPLLTRTPSRLPDSVNSASASLHSHGTASGFPPRRPSARGILSPSWISFTLSTHHEKRFYHLVLPLLLPLS